MRAFLAMWQLFIRLCASICSHAGPAHIQTLYRVQVADKAAEHSELYDQDLNLDP